LGGTVVRATPSRSEGVSEPIGKAGAPGNQPARLQILTEARGLRLFVETPRSEHPKILV
jgi:hypothetical protein